MSRADRRKRIRPYLFPAVALLVYGVTAVFHPDTARDALLYFIALFIRILPVLGLVFVFLFLVNRFVKPEWIQRQTGAESGLRGWLFAVIGGILISGPPSLLYPMLGEMKTLGARNGLMSAMLYNRNVKPHFLPAMVYFFGIKYTIVLSGYIILFSLLNGKILEFFVRE